MKDHMPDVSPSFVFDAKVLQNPHPIYARLRSDTPVVQGVMDTGLRVWILTRYEDMRVAMSDPRLSKDLEQAKELIKKHSRTSATQEAYGRLLGKHMLNADPPDHTRLRRLAMMALTPGRVERLRPKIEKTAATLLDAMAGAEQVDLIEQYAFPLPLSVICDLFGMPGEDRADFHRWTAAMSTDSASVGLTTEGRQDSARQAAASIAEYLASLVAHKQTHPGDDLITALIEARDERGALTGDELVSMAFLTLVAGHETVAHLIGNGMLALFLHPEQFAALRADLSQLPAAVEEFLRFDGPANTAMLRHTTEPVEIGGVTIPADEFVVAILTSGNRDAARYPEPDHFDITRSAMGHLTFGHGVHYCVGAPLARIEGEVAFRALLQRFPGIRLAVPPEKLSWRPSTLIRGLEELPVSLGG